MNTNSELCIKLQHIEGRINKIGEGIIMYIIHSSAEGAYLIQAG